jgi:serine/threonine protein phosphatase PrpC
MTAVPGRIELNDVQIGFLTDPGLSRTENQDALFVPDSPEMDTEKKGVLVAVADGMGGRSGGSLAARTVVSSLKAY